MSGVTRFSLLLIVGELKWAKMESACEINEDPRA
jgi:hypothetical protein